MKHRAITCLTILLLLPWASQLPGCSQGASRLTHLSGKVTLGGSPLTKVCVVLLSTTGKIVSAPVDDDGKYAIAIAPGNYQVSLQRDASGDATQPLRTQFGTVERTLPFPARYAHFDSSGLWVEVQSDSDTTQDYAL